MIRTDVSYLLHFPAPKKYHGGIPTPATKPKDAPYFYNLDIEVNLVESWREMINGVEVHIIARLLDNQVIATEAQYSLPNGFEPDNFSLKEKMNTALRTFILEKYKVKSHLNEEYSILMFPELKISPAEFISKNKRALSRYIRTTEKPLDESEIKRTLSAQLHYSESDATIIDWEGAILCSEQSEFKQDIELFMVGNYQLLRYRMIDDSIDAALKKIRAALEHRKKNFLSRADTSLENVVSSQLSILLDFEKINQSLLLIGDWYSAQMYRLIVDEFYIDEWKEVVSKKLQSLSSIDETVRQNLTLSWSRLLDFIQIAGWMIILIGYFIIFFKDYSSIQ